MGVDNTHAYPARIYGYDSRGNGCFSLYYEYMALENPEKCVHLIFCFSNFLLSCVAPLKKCLTFNVNMYRGDDNPYNQFRAALTLFLYHTRPPIRHIHSVTTNRKSFELRYPYALHVRSFLFLAWKFFCSLSPAVLLFLTVRFVSHPHFIVVDVDLQTFTSNQKYIYINCYSLFVFKVKPSLTFYKIDHFYLSFFDLLGVCTIFLFRQYVLIQPLELFWICCPRHLLHVRAVEKRTASSEKTNINGLSCKYILIN